MIWLFLFFALLSGYRVFSQKVFVIKVAESINPATAEFIQSAIKTSKQQQAECLVIELNTPGGLLSSTREIVSDILNSSVPVIVYIAPSGARAGSAGVFVTMASNIAAMAPGTNIGAAHPVNLQGQTDAILNEKSTNDAAAFIRSIAEKRNRNAVWAEDAVRMSVSITESQAVSENVVNLIADNEQQLLQKIDGLSVTTASGTKILQTAHAQTEELEMGFFLKFLSKLSDPNIAYVLMMIGFLGLVFELFNPGAIFPGIIGVISLVLAFYTMSSLPVNYAGVALIVFGIILYLLEIKVISHGMLAIGGTISVLLGSMFLFRTSSTQDVTSLSWVVIITTTATTLLFFLFIIGMGLRAQRLKPVSGQSALIGKEGLTITQMNPDGMVKVAGETWKAVSDTGFMPADTKVKVTEVKGLTLHVSKTDENKVSRV